MENFYNYYKYLYKIIKIYKYKIFIFINISIINIKSFFLVSLNILPRLAASINATF